MISLRLGWKWWLNVCFMIAIFSCSYTFLWALTVMLWNDITQFYAQTCSFILNFIIRISTLNENMVVKIWKIWSFRYCFIYLNFLLQNWNSLWNIFANIVMQIYILMITAINVEFKQRFISSIKYHNKYYALNISYTFAYYVHYTCTCMFYFACFIYLFEFFTNVRPSSIDLLSINSVHVHHLPCKLYIIRKEFSILFQII